MSYKIDLHTHSMASPDGSLDREAYHKMLVGGGLDYVAVTDHNTIDGAMQLQAELGDHIIVGEEITTSEGEIIGLYLTRNIPALLTPEETVREIHQQGGLVYVPHPFETIRSGIALPVLERIAGEVDIVEMHNGRAYAQNRGRQAEAWAKKHQIAMAASSDAHGPTGWGRTYSLLAKKPGRDTLVVLLQAAMYSRRFVGLRGSLYPKFNRIRKKIHHA